MINEWGSGTWTFEKQHAVHEASLLNLTIDKAYQLLGWYPVWDFRKTIKRTVEWYRIYKEDPDKIPNLTLQQITDYSDTFISTK